MKLTLSKTQTLRIAIGTLLLASAGALQADPREAEDVAYRMAGSYMAKSFSMSPTDHSGVLSSGQAVRFLIPVTKGLDYVFLCGADQSAIDTDIYVYDEVGNLILDDRRKSKLAGVQFRASYNGTALVYLHMARAKGLASYYVLVGRRGVPKTDQVLTQAIAPEGTGFTAPSAAENAGATPEAAILPPK
jgi:hypothetical protein